MSGRSGDHQAPTWYRLLGRIVACELPHGAVLRVRKGEGVVVLHNPEIRRLSRASHLKARSQGGGTGFLSASPSEISVDSDWTVEVRVRAATEEEARLDAWNRLLPPVMAAITIQTGDSPHIELLRAAPEDDKGAVLDDGWSLWSDSALARSYEAVPAMATEDRDHTADLVEQIRADKVAMGSATDLVEATKLDVTKGGRTSETAAALLRYFHVIERIAKKVANARPSMPGGDVRRREVLNKLAADLARDSDVDFRARRVRNAAQALQQADGARLAGDIEYTVQRLQLDVSDGAVALQLNKLRNQQLAHPGRGLRIDKRTPSTEAARLAALAFLRAYVDSY